MMAGTTGLEPATSAVTGQRSNQLNYVPNLLKINSARHLPVLRRPLRELPVRELLPGAETMVISG